MSIETIMDEIREERERQDEKWGEQNIPDGTGSPVWADAAIRAKYQTDHAARRGECTYRHVLYEEVMEAFAESDADLLRVELLQVAAVAVAWVEKLDREKDHDIYSVQEPPC